MKRATLGVLVAGIVAGAMACESNTAELALPPTPPPPVAPTVRSLATALCDLAYRCCTQGEINYYLGPYVQDDDCEERLLRATQLESSLGFSLQLSEQVSLDLPNLGALEQANLEGRGTVSEQDVADCIAYLEGLDCAMEEEEQAGCVPPDPPPEETPCDADNLFIGSVPSGGECSSPGTSYECAEGLVCRTNSSLGVTGQCVPAGQQGDLCFANPECDDELYCSLLDGTCQPLRQEGESCVYADRDDPSPTPGTLLLACEPHLYCDPVTDSCVAYCQRGAPCAVEEQCDEEAELSCILGRCDELRGEGLPCGIDDDCAEDRACGFDPNYPGTLVCIDRLANDEVCLSHVECQSGFCSPLTMRCAATVGADQPCPSTLDEECNMGVCEQEVVYCTDDGDCPLSGSCNLLINQCGTYCVALRPDGATCTLDDECLSGVCIAGFCRTPPLGNGQPCDLDDQCESEFCGLETDRVCTELPLSLGARCTASSQCESLVCFAGSPTADLTCMTGLDEGEACNDPTLPPCNPHKYFCDDAEQPAVCAPLYETGEECENSVQCRGTCTLNFGRMMCSPAVPEGSAICDGAGLLPVED